jgi:hypothetical protein
MELITYYQISVETYLTHHNMIRWFAHISLTKMKIKQLIYLGKTFQHQMNKDKTNAVTIFFFKFF